MKESEYLFWHLEGKLQEGQSLIININKSPFTIGRSEDCDLTLSSPSVSRHHAEFTIWKDNLYLKDLDSTNGTKINQKPVKQEVLIHKGDLIQLGESVFRIDNKSLQEEPNFNQTLMQDSEAQSEDFTSHYNLSKRESEVLFYLLDGKTGTAIAEALCVSPGTAKNHMLSIYRKTGTHSKLELSTLYRNFQTFQNN